MTTAAPALTTELEFLSLPESNQRIELVDGEVIVAPSPTFRHQEIHMRIMEALRAWARARGADATVIHAPFDVRFAPGRILQPDAMVFMPALAANTDTPVNQIPNLVIEVVSTNRVYDRVAKRAIYGSAGVQEYWLVDSITSQIEVCSGAGLQASRVEGERLETSLLPGFTLDIAALFAGV